MLTQKIKTLNEMYDITKNLRKEGKTIVHCHGVFDLLHIGHIRYFHQAKVHGDILLVTLTPDRFVDKGPGRPAFSERLRAEAIASLAEVDYVAINEWPTAEETLRLLKPDIYAKGSEFEAPKSDYTGKIDKEIKIVNEIGARMVFTHDIVFSSSNLINRFMSEYPKEIQEYLELFRKRYSIDQIKELFERLADLNVLVIGDALLDEYHFGEILGKSNKDPVLVMHHKSNELYSGGVLAVGNHVANFAKRVHLYTALGKKESKEEFIRKSLHENINPHFYYKPDAKTTIMSRFLDGESLNKLFELYALNSDELPQDTCCQFCEELENCLPDFDIVIVADFGMGLIGQSMIDTLTNHSKFLAVSTQSNAANHGYHTISKYPCADLINLTEFELRLDFRNTTGSLRPLMTELVERTKCKTLVVNRGRQGSSILTQDGKYVVSPSLATQTIDRVGASEAVFALVSLCSSLQCEPEIMGLIGNVVGSLAVGSIGNKESIQKESVIKYITALLK